MLKKFRKVISYLLDTDSTAYFLAICIVTILVLFAKKSLVENQTIAFQILQEEGRFGIFQLLNTLQFLAIPIIYAYKVTLIAFVLWVGAFMFGYRITYKQMWHVALVSETVFLLAEVVKIMWFILIDRQPEIPEIIAFYPLSLMNLFTPQLITDNLQYPLKALNLFELFYWFVLVEAVHITANKKWIYAFAIVFTTYVPGFLIWLIYYSLIYK